MKNNYIGLLRRKDSTGNPEKGTFGKFSSMRTKKTGGWLTGLFAVASLLLSSSNAFAQTNVSAYSFSKSTGVTYTPITGGTKLFPSGTNTTYDNDISSAITLSAPFTYGGVAVTTVYVSANGFITFGAAPDGANYTPLSTAVGSTTGAISAFGQDAASSTATGAASEVSYLDSGTEFIIQYKDHANYYNRTTEKLNFQIRLNYATGAINIIYGSCTDPGTAGTSTTPQVGIRGNSTTYATNVSPLMIGNVPTGTTCDWSKAVTGNANTSTMLFAGGTNVNVKIPNGLQYTWTPGTQLPIRTFAATTGVTNNAAILSWTAPTGATTYNVQYRVLGTCDWTNFSGNPVSAVTASLSGLTQNTTYQVQVQALNGTAQSVYSHIPNLAGTGNGYATAGSFTTTYNCASTVTGLTSSALAPNSATISWTASTTAPASGYEYYYSTSSTAPTVTTTPSGSVGASIVTANLSGLTPSTQYYYWVRGNCNGTDKGVWSSSANFTTLSLCPTVSSPAANATGVSLNPTITWAVINGATGYKIKVGTTSGANNIVDADVVGGSSTSYPITATLNNATTYYYSVTAYTATTTAPATPCSIRMFTTICSASNVPYSENFDTTAVGSTTNTNAPTCWKYLEPTGWAGYGYVSTTAFTSTPNGYYIYTDTATTGGGMLVSPQTTNLTNGNNRVRFSANGGGAGYTMEVGTLSDPNDAATFVAIGSPISLTTTMSPYIVNIPAGTNQYLAFRHGGGSGRSIRLDDIFVEVAPSCLEPTAIVASNITSSGASIAWTAPATVPANGYEYYYSTTNTAPTATTTVSGTSTGTSTPLSGLAANTTYYVWVRSVCTGSTNSVWSTVSSFTTACNVYVPSYTNDFSTFPGACWTLANGGTPASGPGTGTTNYWIEDGFLNNTSVGAARINLYSTGRAGWLISPTFNLTAGGYQVKFNYGITTYSGTTTSAMGSDDIVNVLMSTDNGATWTVVQTWNAANAPNNTSNAFVYPIASTSGQVKFAVYGSDGTVDDSEDYNFYVDNFVVETTPSCVEPTAIVVSNITAAAATIAWTAPATVPANGYEFYYSITNTAPTATTTVSGTSATASTPLSGLAAATTYYVWVRSACSTSLKSAWSSIATFTTLCDATNVPYTLDFANVVTPGLPTCTSAVNYGNGNTWTTYAPGATGFTGNVLNYEYHGTSAANTWFFTQGINLTAGTSYRIQYKYGNNGGTTFPEKLKVAYGSSAVNTAMTNQLADHGNITNTAATSTFVDFTPATTGIYYFGFQAYSDADMNRLYVDDINIDVAPACSEPTAVTVTGITTTGANVAWTAPANAPASGYEVYYSTSNTAPTATSTPNLTVTTTSTPLQQLTQGTTYYVWVRSNCGATKSVWTTVTSFTTLIPAPANDVCSGAVALIPGATFAQNAITTTNVGATTDGTTSCQTNRGDNVWYTVVVPASGNITVETQSVAGSGLLDTVLSVHSGTCGGTLTSIACDDDSSTDGSFSLVSLTGQTPGATLYVSVWRYTGTIGGASTNGQFKLSAYDASLSTSESVKTKNEIKVYPNPFADVLNISDISNVKSISVVDISGKLVKTFDKPESTLYLRELNSGMYLVVLNMKDGSKQTIKAIKK